MPHNRVQLPDDFLVLPDPNTYLFTDKYDEEDQDAMLAQLLQDELFLEQLRDHPDFEAYIE